MDMESGKQELITVIKKYRYVLLVVLLGVFLMLIPQDSQDAPENMQQQVPPVQDLEEELTVILSQISGVGKTSVLLTELSGSDTIYQTDTGQNQSHVDTVIVMNREREETGLVKQILPPVYKGALVVCQGGDNAQVRLAVVHAVRSVTGLSSDCITVLKMK